MATPSPSPAPTTEPKQEAKEEKKEEKKEAKTEGEGQGSGEKNKEKVKTNRKCCGGSDHAPQRELTTEEKEEAARQAKAEAAADEQKQIEKLSKQLVELEAKKRTREVELKERREKELSELPEDKRRQRQLQELQEQVKALETFIEADLKKYHQYHVEVTIASAKLNTEAAAYVVAEWKATSCAMPQPVTKTEHTATHKNPEWNHKVIFKYTASQKDPAILHLKLWNNALFRDSEIGEAEWPIEISETASHVKIYKKEWKQVDKHRQFVTSEVGEITVKAEKYTPPPPSTTTAK